MGSGSDCHKPATQLSVIGRRLPAAHIADGFDNLHIAQPAEQVGISQATQPYQQWSIQLNLIGLSRLIIFGGILAELELEAVDLYLHPKP